MSRWKDLPSELKFWKWPISKDSIFYATDLTFCFTNLKPVLPGHVLVSPRRVVSRMADLTREEIHDLFESARFAGEVVTKAHPASDSLTFTVQDGANAGQTVAHVHVHVLPRFAQDRFNRNGKNDEIYREIDGVDSVSQPREIQEMCNEASQLREIVESLQDSR